MHSFAWWPTVIVLAISCLTDLRSRRIPNWLVLPFLFAGLCYAGWQHGWVGLGRSFAGVLIATVIFGIFFFMDGMGAGDVKLCAAVGAWIGPHQLMLAMVLIGLAGGIMVLCWAAWRGSFRSLISACAGLVPRFARRSEARHEVDAVNVAARHAIPYAPAIAVGTLLSFFAH